MTTASTTEQHSPAPGVYENIDATTYHEWNGATLSKSRLWDMVVGINSDRTLELCPAKLKHRIEHPKAPTAAMREGDALDCKLLEPHEFEQRFIMASSCNKELASGARKGEACGHPGVGMVDGEWRCGKHGATEGGGIPPEKTLLDHVQMSVVRGQARSLLDHPDARRRIEGATAHQVAMVDSIYGRPFKGRFDIFWANDDGVPGIVDLKRTAYWQPHRVTNHILNQGWHVQLFGYSALGFKHGWLDASSTIELALVGDSPLFGSGKDAVYPVRIYQVDDELLELGAEHLEQLMNLYDECRATDHWPVVHHPPMSVTVPGWMNNQNDEGSGDYE